MSVNNFYIGQLLSKCLLPPEKEVSSWQDLITEFLEHNIVSVVDDRIIAIVVMRNSL